MCITRIQTRSPTARQNGFDFEGAIDYLLDPVSATMGNNAQGRQVYGVMSLHVADLPSHRVQRFDEH